MTHRPETAYKAYTAKNRRSDAVESVSMINDLMYGGEGPSSNKADGGVAVWKRGGKRVLYPALRVRCRIEPPAASLVPPAVLFLLDRIAFVFLQITRAIPMCGMNLTA